MGRRVPPLARAAALVGLPFYFAAFLQLVAAVTVTTPETLLTALADPAIDAIELPAGTVLGALCDGTPNPCAAIPPLTRALSLSGPPNAGGSLLPGAGANGLFSVGAGGYLTVSHLTLALGAGDATPARLDDALFPPVFDVLAGTDGTLSFQDCTFVLSGSSGTLLHTGAGSGDVPMSITLSREGPGAAAVGSLAPVSLTASHGVPGLRLSRSSTSSIVSSDAVSGWTGSWVFSGTTSLVLDPLACYEGGAVLKSGRDVRPSLLAAAPSLYLAVDLENFVDAWPQAGVSPGLEELHSVAHGAFPDNSGVSLAADTRIYGCGGVRWNQRYLGRSVFVRAGQTLTIEGTDSLGIVLARSNANADDFWFPLDPAFPSFFSVPEFSRDARIVMRHVTIESYHRGYTLDSTSPLWTSASFTALRPTLTSGATSVEPAALEADIASWELDRTAVVAKTTGLDAQELNSLCLNQPQLDGDTVDLSATCEDVYGIPVWRWDASWSYENVKVKYVPFDVCTSIGFGVTTGLALKNALKDPEISHIIVTRDIEVSPDDWPEPDQEASGVDDFGVQIRRRVTLSACPEDGDEVVVDLNNIGQTVYVFDGGHLDWMGTEKGSFRFVEPFQSTRRGDQFALMGFFSVEEDGVMMVAHSTIEGMALSPMNDWGDTSWYEGKPKIVQAVPDVNLLCLDDSSSGDAAYCESAYLDNWRLKKNDWVLASSGKNLAEGGYWQYVDVRIIATLPPPAQPPPPESGVISGEESVTQGVIIAIAVCAAAVICAVIALCYCLVVVKPRRRAALEGVMKGDPGEVESGQAFGNQMSSGGTHSGRSKGTGATQSTLLMSLAASHAQEKINVTKMMLSTPSKHGGNDDELKLEELLGTGTFGKVYKGLWRGTEVAVKTMVFPATMTGKEKREKMAIMETAISVSLSHPNIVQTYTYQVRPIMRGKEEMGDHVDRSKIADPKELQSLIEGSTALDGIAAKTAAELDLSKVHSWEVRLVLEYCNLGSMRDVLNQGLFRDENGEPILSSMLETARDVAKAMVHLHSENIIHSDLKARNVLLRSGGDDARGFSARVADFGLSLQIDPGDTHISNVYQGTMTHMAPEVLMSGKMSKAADVYAFGILLWELYTGKQAFKGVPRALLGHEITQNNKRPQFPFTSPFEYQLLACRCWETDADTRPSFQDVLDTIDDIKARLLGDPNHRTSTVITPGSAPQSMHKAPGMLGQSATKPSEWASSGSNTAGPLHSNKGEAQGQIQGPSAIVLLPKRDDPNVKAGPPAAPDEELSDLDSMSELETRLSNITRSGSAKMNK